MNAARSRLVLILTLAAGLFLLGLAPSPTYPQTPGVYKVIVEKQEEKKRSRWTLAEWMSQKRDMRLMDLWLAKNSYSSPYEFYLDGSAHNYDRKTSSAPEQHENYNGQCGELAAYAGPVGIKGHYSSNDEHRSSWQGSLNLRVYGQAIQDTHINLEWGLKGLSIEEPDERFQNQFGGVNLNFYLTKHFGVGGRYARILPARSSLKNSLEGEEVSGKVFIDFWAVQLYGEWRQEHLVKKTEPSTATETRSGYGGGLRIFF